MKLRQILNEVVLSNTIYYHGTNNTFDKFKYTDKSGVAGDFYGKGIYVTDNLEYAREFGKNILKCKVTATKPFDILKAREGMFDEFLPFIKDQDDIEAIQSCLRMRALATGFRYIRKHVSPDDMEKIGYDCIMAHADHPNGGIEIIIFDPNKVEIIK